MRYPCSFRDTVRAVASGTLDIDYFLRVLRKALAKKNQGRTKENRAYKVFHIEIQKQNAGQLVKPGISLQISMNYLMLATSSALYEIL